jgi:hypothetical protein
MKKRPTGAFRLHIDLVLIYTFIVSFACAYSLSVLAAMMKSLRCSPLIAWVHQETVTFPYSVRMAGWWSSASAIPPTLLVNPNAWAKSLNGKIRSRR